MSMQQQSDLRICTEMPTEKDVNLQRSLHHLEKTDSGTAAALRAAYLKSALWSQDSTIKIAFMPGNVTSLQKIQFTKLEFMNARPLDRLEKVLRSEAPTTEEFVKSVITNRIEPLINLTIKWVDNIQDSDVRIAILNDGKGSWSYVGTACQNIPKSQPTMHFSWLDVGTVIHECLHMLGAVHEHQNPRGVGIPWNVDSVYEFYGKTQGWDRETVYNNILKKYNVDQIAGSDFDDKSVMLYFYPADVTLDHTARPQNFTLSKMDVEWLNKTYPKSLVVDTDIYTKFQEKDEKDEKDKKDDNTENPFLLKLTELWDKIYPYRWLILAAAISIIALVLLYRRFNELQEPSLLPSHDEIKLANPSTSQYNPDIMSQKSVELANSPFLIDLSRPTKPSSLPTKPSSLPSHGEIKSVNPSTVYNPPQPKFKPSFLQTPLQNPLQNRQEVGVPAASNVYNPPQPKFKPSFLQTPLQNRQEVGVPAASNVYNPPQPKFKPSTL